MLHCLLVVRHVNQTWGTIQDFLPPTQDGSISTTGHVCVYVIFSMHKYLLNHHQTVFVLIITDI